MSIFSLGFLANREHRECTVCGIRISLTLGLICLQGRFSLCTKLGKKKKEEEERLTLLVDVIYWSLSGS